MVLRYCMPIAAWHVLKHERSEENRLPDLSECADLGFELLTCFTRDHQLMPQAEYSSLVPRGMSSGPVAPRSWGE